MVPLVGRSIYNDNNRTSSISYVPFRDTCDEGRTDASGGPHFVLARG